MMNWKQEGKAVTLTMTHDDYERLLVILGYALGAASWYDSDLAGPMVRFMNELNRDNPDYVAYEEPKVVANQSGQRRW